MDAKRCICRGQAFETLLGAYTARAKARIAAGVTQGKAPPEMAELRMTVTLIRALSTGVGQGPFQARFAHLDHHLHECPCSPRYVAPTADSPTP